MASYTSRKGTQTQPSDFWTDPVIDNPSTNTEHGSLRTDLWHGKPKVSFPRFWLTSACLSTQVPQVGLGSTAGRVPLSMVRASNAPENCNKQGRN
jgi:hypothetical protein